MSESFKPKGLSMDNYAAQELFVKGGKALILDVPAGTEIGIDYNAWNVGERFKGIKFIPKGLHFIYFSATNAKNINKGNNMAQSTNSPQDKQGMQMQMETAPRTGYFQWYDEGQVHVKQWHPTNEELIGVCRK